MKTICFKISLMVLLLSYGYCTKSPIDPETGSLSGNVYLENKANHSGITVVYPVRYVTKIMNNMKKIQYAIYRIMIGNGQLSNGAGKLAELDTTILRYNREYPLARRVFGGNVGFFTRRLFGGPISQATEFACPPSFWRACLPGVWQNHRLGEVVAEAKTKQDGSFEIDGVEQGTYNLVAEKAGFGWKYLYPVR